MSNSVSISKAEMAKGGDVAQNVKSGTYTITAAGIWGKTKSPCLTLSHATIGTTVRVGASQFHKAAAESSCNELFTDGGAEWQFIIGIPFEFAADNWVITMSMPTAEAEPTDAEILAAAKAAKAAKSAKK
jgi:hypothetical protein